MTYEDHEPASEQPPYETLVETGTLTGATVDGQIIRDAITCIRLREIDLQPGGLMLIGCTVLGDVNLNNLSLPFGLSLLRCRIEGSLFLRRTSVSHLILDGSRASGIDLSEGVVFGHLSATEIETPYLIADMARFGRATLSGSHLGPGPDSMALDLSHSTIAGDLDLTNLQVAGRAELYLTEVGGEALVDGAFSEGGIAEDSAWLEKIRRGARGRPKADPRGVPLPRELDTRKYRLANTISASTPLWAAWLLSFPYFFLGQAKPAAEWSQLIAMAVLFGTATWASFELVAQVGLRSLVQRIVIRLMSGTRLTLSTSTYALPAPRLVGQLGAALRGRLSSDVLEPWLDGILIELTASWARVRTLWVLLLAVTLTTAALYPTGRWWPEGLVVAITASAIAWTLADLRARLSPAN